MNPPVALTIAGTDSGGAAGVAADLATFAAHGAHGACVVTAVTAQDTNGVRDIHTTPEGSVRAQLAAVFDDLPVAAAKTGMLGSAETVATVSEVLGRSHPRLPLVVDPVLVATSGSVLGDDEVRRAYLEHLLPVATVVTPNLDEARALAGRDGTPAELTAELAALGPAVIVTGGPGGLATAATRPPRPPVCTDWLALPGRDPEPLEHPAVATTNDHGTGCTFSAALAARLASGADLPAAARSAAAYTTRQLRLSSTWTLGRGRGPIAHVSTGSTTGSTGSTTDKENP